MNLFAAVAVVTLIAFAGAFIAWVNRVRKKLKLWVTTELSKVVRAVMVSNNATTTELRNNGGTSMKDSVDRIEKMVDGVAATVSGLTSSIEDVRATTNDNRQRITNLLDPQRGIPK